MSYESHIVILISANAEWKAVKRYFENIKVFPSPFGEWFVQDYKDSSGDLQKTIFFHGGWGKVAASSSTQYAIDRWKPIYLINLGTCGGFAGKVNKFEIILAERTLIYDIYEQMGDAEEHIKFYEVNFDNTWIKLPYPISVTKALLISGDRDLFVDDIGRLHEKYGAIAGDWESGAIAWVAKQNKIKCLILRGISDLVNEEMGEAYGGNIQLFHQNTETVMNLLLGSLPGWILALG